MEPRLKGIVLSEFHEIKCKPKVLRVKKYRILELG